MNMVAISAKRYSTKHYNKDKKIPDDQLEQLCSILQNSPSSVNSQPWHFIIISSDEVRNKISPSIRDFNLPRITDSSHIIIMCVRTELGEAHLKNILEQEDKDGRYLAEQDKQMASDARSYFVSLYSTTVERRLTWESNQVYIALGNLLFAAAGLGIDSTPIEGFDRAKMDEILGLKEKGLKSVVIAALGYRKEDDSNAKRPKSRLPKEQIFTFL